MHPSSIEMLPDLNKIAPLLPPLGVPISLVDVEADEDEEEIAAPSLDLLVENCCIYFFVVGGAVVWS